MVKIMKDNNKRGFTLVELLATMLLISIVFGIGYTFISKIISNSREKTDYLAKSNVQRSADLYLKEYPSNISWISSDNNQTTCVSVVELVQNGYFKEEQVDKYLNSYVYFVRNDSYASLDQMDLRKPSWLSTCSVRNLY